MLVYDLLLLQAWPSSCASAPPALQALPRYAASMLIVSPGKLETLCSRRSGGTLCGTLFSPSLSSSRSSMQLEQEQPRLPRILLAATGSVATVKVPQLVEVLQCLGTVRLLLTSAASNFLANRNSLPLPQDNIYGDENEWRDWAKVGDPVLHIELRRWADVLVIAPLSANSLAKISTGLCDNLVTCVARAWDYQAAPLVVAPAMNTLMWESPLTGSQLSTLTSMGATVVPPVAKTLACGDVGLGAMASPGQIGAAVEEVLQAAGKLPAPGAGVSSVAGAGAPTLQGSGAAAGVAGDAAVTATGAAAGAAVAAPRMVDLRGDAAVTATGATVPVSKGLDLGKGVLERSRHVLGLSPRELLAALAGLVVGSGLAAIAGVCAYALGRRDGRRAS